MTTLIGWLGRDQRLPSSLYFAADSRFTWDANTKWDYGRKLFASRSLPAMFGYCGDVLFASQSIAQALELLESGILHSMDAPLRMRRDALRAFLEASRQTYPRAHLSEFSVLYAWRDGSGM